jgi:hypothetical protein
MSCLLLSKAITTIAIAIAIAIAVVASIAKD